MYPNSTVLTEINCKGWNEHSQITDDLLPTLLRRLLVRLQQVPPTAILLVEASTKLKGAGIDHQVCNNDYAGPRTTATDEISVDDDESHRSNN